MLYRCVSLMFRQVIEESFYKAAHHYVSLPSNIKTMLHFMNLEIEFIKMKNGATFHFFPPNMDYEFSLEPLR